MTSTSAFIDNKFKQQHQLKQKSNFSNLPLELLYRIFSYLEYLDLGVIMDLCQRLRFAIKSYKIVCKDTYLNQKDTSDNTSSSSCDE